jgi:S1-C subfamily serine protease
MNIRDLSGFERVVAVMLVLLLCGLLGLGGAIALSVSGFFAPQAEEPLAQVEMATPPPPTVTPTATLPPTFTPSPTGTPTPIPPTNTLVPIPPTETYTPVPPADMPATALTSAQGIERAVLAAVQLSVPVEGLDVTSQGTGSVVDSRGYILTNYHIIGDLGSRQLYNNQGLVYVAVSSLSLSKPPEVLYRAALVDADVDLDLALLRISATKDGASLTEPVNLMAVTVGNSDQTHIGDSITVVGFPALGLGTVTLTQGTISGFLAEGRFERGWIKTDAEINSGNSGGLAINEAGELIGVPSVVVSSLFSSGKISYVRPVNVAHPLLRNIP